MKENNGLIVVLGIILVVSLLGNFYLYGLSTKDNVNVPEEKALVDVLMTLWAENIYDSSEMFFDYTVYNYGNSEVKNLKVTCEVWDEDGLNKLHSSTDTYGNLASNSFEMEEYTTKNIQTIPETEYYSFCYVESCDNCEILHERIPELVEIYSE